MTTTQMRQVLKRKIDGLSDERLHVAADFLSYLEDRESNEATEELLCIPGIMEAIETGEKEIAQGLFTDVRAPNGKGRRVHRAS